MQLPDPQALGSGDITREHRVGHPIQARAVV